jgi:hypothetical protein
MKIENKILITRPFFSNLFLKLVSGFNRFLVFIQLKKPKEFWGIVYDSISKQPLDPVTNFKKRLLKKGRVIKILFSIFIDF